MPESRLRLTSCSSQERRLRLSRRRHQLRHLYLYPFLHELLVLRVTAPRHRLEKAGVETRFVEILNLIPEGARLHGRRQRTRIGSGRAIARR